MRTHNTANVNGLSVFDREAGEESNPKLLLLGGFPASSHQFRNLGRALADRFHVLSPDSGHFAVEDRLDEIVAHIKRSYDRSANGARA